MYLTTFDLHPGHVPSLEHGSVQNAWWLLPPDTRARTSHDMNLTQWLTASWTSTLLFNPVTKASWLHVSLSMTSSMLCCQMVKDLRAQSQA